MTTGRAWHPEGRFIPEVTLGGSDLSVPAVSGALAGAGVPRWLVIRLQNVDPNSGAIARFFEHLAEQNIPGTRKILVVADELGLDHELLYSLLADLGWV